MTLKNATLDVFEDCAFGRHLLVVLAGIGVERSIGVWRSELPPEGYIDLLRIRFDALEIPGHCGY